MALKLEYEGRKCEASILLQALLLAASRVASVFGVCRDLTDSPCDQTIRNALADALPEIADLERRVKLCFLPLGKGLLSVGVIWLRALRKKKDGYYRHTPTGKVDGKDRAAPTATCFASNRYAARRALGSLDRLRL